MNYSKALSQQRAYEAAGTLRQSWLSRVGLSIQLHGSTSCFDRLAAAEHELVRWPAVLDILLRATVPSSWGGREVLWPLWANEAMHRAHRMMRVALQLEHCIESGGHATWFAQRFENAIALASIFAELRIADDREVLACSTLLRDAVVRLVGVFSTPACSLETHIALKDIDLPAYQRRALILAATTLIMQVLTCASDSGCEPVVSISLSSPSSQRTRLEVATKGLARMEEDAREVDDIVDGLADLLEVRNVRRLQWIDGFITQIDFPGVL